MFLSIAYVSILSVLLPLAIGLWDRQPKNDVLKPVVWVAIASFILDCLSWILVMNKKNSFPAANLYFIIQFVLMYMTFARYQNIKYLRFTFFTFTAFAVANFLFYQGLNTFNSYTVYVSSLLMIVCSIASLRLLMEEETQNVQLLPMFWFSFGVLIYYGGSLFIFLFNNYLIKYLPTSHLNVWSLHDVLNIIKNIFLFMTLWVNYKSKTSQS